MVVLANNWLRVSAGASSRGLRQVSVERRAKQFGAECDLD